MPRRSESPDRGRQRKEDSHRSGKHKPDRHHSGDYHRRRASRSRSHSRSRSPLPSSSGPRHQHTPSRSRSPKRRQFSPSRSRSHERDHHKGKHRHGRSPSKSRSRDSSVSSDRKSRNYKKDKHRKGRSSRSRERKKRKREKKEKKEKKKKQKLSHTTQWGKYGIISEVDIFTKGPEFHTWLVEERKINPETMSKDQSKKEFARFMEDYNTATLPHEKYYHMEAYQQRMARLRSGEFVPPPEDSYDPTADLLAHQSKLKKQTVETESYLNKEQLLELRKVQHERIEAAKMKLLGMDVKLNMGVRMDGTMFDE